MFPLHLKATTTRPSGTLQGSATSLMRNVKLNNVALISSALLELQEDGREPQLQPITGKSKFKEVNKKCTRTFGFVGMTLNDVCQRYKAEVGDRLAQGTKCMAYFDKDKP